MSIGSEKSALVLEVGGKYVKCGLSSERAPRCIVRWEVAEMIRAGHVDAAQWHHYLYPKLHSIFYDYMHVNPTQRRFLVCEELLFPRLFREVLLKVLFTVFKVSAVTVAPSILTALYATSHHTALIIDCGWAETRLLPVFKGIPMQYLYVTIPAASRTCCERILREMEHYSAAKLKLSDAEDILERACFVQPKVPIADVVDAEFLTNTQDTLKVPGSLRTDAIKHLFTGNEDTEGNSIIDAVLQLIKRLPVDVTAAMLENLLLIGGTAMIPGFAQRLLSEVRDALQQDNEVSSNFAKVASNRVRLVPTYFPRNMMVWIGGSIYAATENARSSAISLAEYNSGDKSLPDWLSVAGSSGIDGN